MSHVKHLEVGDLNVGAQEDDYCSRRDESNILNSVDEILELPLLACVDAVRCLDPVEDPEIPYNHA